MSDSQKLIPKGFLKFYINEFLSTTAIRGFSFIRASRSFSEKVLWIFIILAFISLTVRDIYRSIDIYLSQPTSSRFTFISNLSITLDQPIICARTDFTALNFGFDEKNITELSNFLTSYQYVTDTESFISNYLASSTLSNESADSFIYLLTIMLTDIVRLEQFVLDPNKILKLGFYRTGKSTAIEGSELAAIQIYSFFLKRSTNYSRLLQLACSFLCRKLNVKATRYKINFVNGSLEQLIETPCKPENCMWLGLYNRTQMHLVCLKAMGNKTFTVSKPFDSIFITLSPYDILRNSGVDSSVWASQGILGFGSSFGHRNLDELLIPYGEQTSILIQILGDYRTVSTKKKACGSISYFDCVIGCQSELIEKYCNCSPISSLPLKSIPRTYSDCGEKSNLKSDLTIDLLRCQGSIPQFESEMCLNELCPESCTNLLFSYSFGPFKQNQYVNQTVLQLAVTKFSYPQIIEYFTTSFEDLIVRFAGNLSLWLGASFIALIHACVFLLKIPWEIRDFTIERKPDKMVSKVEAENISEYPKFRFTRKLAQ